MASLIQPTLCEMNVAGLRTEEAFGQIRDRATDGGGGGGGVVCVQESGSPIVEVLILRSPDCGEKVNQDGLLHIQPGCVFMRLYRRYNLYLTCGC